MEVTLGGERLGSGNKNKIHMHNYERSTHDLSYIWRSTMASGTLVPFMTELTLPGDTFDIHLNCDVLTHPTIGPLFGSYKIQLDVFQVPVRLYQAQLHMNMLNIGRDMSKVKLPQLTISASDVDPAKPVDNQQINPSCILSYLGIRGLGVNVDPLVNSEVSRNFNAIPYLGYWDIYKNYYANKQEEIGMVIHKTLDPDPLVITEARLENCIPEILIPIAPIPPIAPYTESTTIQSETILVIAGTGISLVTDPNQIYIYIQYPQTGALGIVTGLQMFRDWAINEDAGTMVGSNPNPYYFNYEGLRFGGIVSIQEVNPEISTEPQLLTFQLEDIDTMRVKILQHPDPDVPFYINANTLQRPYDLPFRQFTPSGGQKVWTKQFSQEGLGIKTYNSDLFNNWISTEWIDGADGISEITRVGVGTEGFTIDELNLSSKIYNMLNRISLSGGTYDDWLDAVYTEKRHRSAENPMYLGGLIKNLVFQEVVSNSRSLDQPLGTLAGRGTVGGKHKGGKIIAKIDEPSYLIGIVSITPNIDYSQGNKWDTNLATMNDFHKPALDSIGFQDLITDQMAWFDTKIDNTGIEYEYIFKSAGKQPAWINYMTNVNKVYGNFAEQAQQMFMVLNRRYTPVYDSVAGWEIGDVTTYIDPVKFNHIFANTRRDAQNFWTQISVDINARRKMSAKVIPNL